MTLEEQIKLHKEISKQIEELEEKKKALGKSILQQMPSKTLNVSGFIVRHYTRLSISVPIEEARVYGAVKLEEMVDKAKLKALYQEGLPIKGINEINYIQISEKKQSPS